MNKHVLAKKIKAAVRANSDFVEDISQGVPKHILEQLKTDIQTIFGAANYERELDAIIRQIRSAPKTAFLSTSELHSILQDRLKDYPNVDNVDAAAFKIIDYLEYKDPKSLESVQGFKIL